MASSASLTLRASLKQKQTAFFACKYSLKAGSDGCRLVRAYECCQREVGSVKGCQLVFKCCMDEREAAQGCQQRYACCKKPLVEEGARYK